MQNLSLDLQGYDSLPPWQSLLHEPQWWSRLQGLFEEPELARLHAFLSGEYAAGKSIYPPQHQIFRALNELPFEQVRVVILGQDPYHGAGQAHGLAFSVPAGVKHPPSLRNIFKELQADLGIKPPQSGDLSHWHRQGVLLLNTSLTVEEGQAGSHAKKGWERVTDRIIAEISGKDDKVVFVLWGNHAQQKKPLIADHHVVIESVHPSPLSASRGFFGSRPFSQIQQVLGQTIDW